MPAWSYLGICWKNLQDTWERLPMSLPGAGEFAWWWHRKLQRFPVRLVLALKVNEGTLWSKARSDCSASLIAGAAWKESFTVRIDEASNVSHILSLLFNASISKDMMKFLKTRCPGNFCPPKLLKFDFGRVALEWRLRASGVAVVQADSQMFGNHWGWGHHVDETTWSHGWNFSVKNCETLGWNFQCWKEGMVSYCRLILVNYSWTTMSVGLHVPTNASSFIIFHTSPLWKVGVLRQRWWGAMGRCTYQTLRGTLARCHLAAWQMLHAEDPGIEMPRTRVWIQVKVEAQNKELERWAVAFFFGWVFLYPAPRAIDDLVSHTLTSLCPCLFCRKRSESWRTSKRLQEVEQWLRQLLRTSDVANW